MLQNDRVFYSIFSTCFKPCRTISEPRWSISPSLYVFFNLYQCLYPLYFLYTPPSHPLYPGRRHQRRGRELPDLSRPRLCPGTHGCGQDFVTPESVTGQTMLAPSLLSPPGHQTRPSGRAVYVVRCR